MTLRAEQNAASEDRFLVAWCRLSAKDAHAFHPPSAQELDAVFALLGYSYADVALPAAYDLVFRYCCNPDEFERVDLSVVHALFYGHQVNRLDRGHKHVAALQFRGGLQQLVEQLPVKPLQADLPAATAWIGICRSENFSAIRRRRQLTRP